MKQSQNNMIATPFRARNDNEEIISGKIYKKGMKLKDLNHLRRISQILFFGFLIYLILQAAFPLELNLPVELFLRLDPLIALISTIAGSSLINKLIPAIVLLAAVIFFGNFFCGWICPMGTIIDFSDWLFFRKSNRRHPGNIEDSTKSRYYILIITIVASIFSVQLLFLFDPISLITRTLIVAFFPSYVSLDSAIYTALNKIYPENGWLRSDPFSPIFNLNIFIFLIFVLILTGGIFQRRFWCKYLCPLGALLGIANKFRVINREVSERCIECGKCQRVCPSGSIYSNPREYSSTQCILCMRCLDCPPEVTNFTFINPLTVKQNGINLSRRYFVGSAAMGIFTASMVKTNPLLASEGKLNNKLIRPPGALPEDKFIATCVGCGKCLKVCPNFALQPTFLEAGLSGMFTPNLVSRIGYCEQLCTLCGEVCPTSAIRRVTVQEKKKIQIGLAKIDTSKCLIWTDNILCIVCNEQCSYQAIYLDEKKRPYVDKDKCTGCGICENKCPVLGESAIIVYSQGKEQKKLP